MRTSVSTSRLSARRLADAVEELAAACGAIRLGARAGDCFPGGHSCLALAHSVLHVALPGRDHAARSDRHLALAARALATHPAGPTLFEGFTGVAWVVAHLTRSSDDGPSVIDEGLEQLLRRRAWRGPYDLAGGLVGYGVYALERFPHPSAARLIERIVDHLEATASRDGAGLTWRSRARWVPRALRTPLSSGWNLGLAHGVPGVVAFLASVHATGIARRRVARLLDGSVAWLLAQELPKSSVSAFPPDVLAAPTPARLGWCYGDPGVALALLRAARASGEPSWRRAALGIAVRAAAREPESARAVDAGLCHGRAGLAHMFLRLYVETGDERLRGAAHAWLARTLDLRDAAGGVTGYRCYVALPGGRGGVWKRDVTFLTGLPGVAMALASFLVDPATPEWGAWDRVLLLSAPRRPGAGA